MKPIDSIFNQFMQGSRKLLALPDIYQQLDKLLKSDHASIVDIGFLISSDAALTAQVLKLANSPAFSFKAEITNIDRAISLIGTQELKNLVLMEVVVKNFNSMNCPALNAEDFWRRSVYQAIIAKKLALHCYHSDPDRLFVCGILSRIGQLMCCSVDPVKTEQVISGTLSSSPSNEKQTELLSEQNIFGFTVNELSARLLRHWKVPDSICTPISTFTFPVQPEHVELGEFKTDCYILYCASIFSFLLEQSDTEVLSAGDLINQIDPQINLHLGLDQDFLSELLLDIEMDAMEILAAVFPDSMVIY
jgi:HD-like signal output (HDOD) protein